MVVTLICYSQYKKKIVCKDSDRFIFILYLLCPLLSLMFENVHLGHRLRARKLALLAILAYPKYPEIC